MRSFKRIPIVLDLLHEHLVEFLQDANAEIDIDDQIALYNVKRQEIEEFWLQVPDLRLTQVLVNFGVIPNLNGSWYYKEEVDYLIEKGFVKFEEIHFWGVNYTKEGVPLEETEFRRLCDLDTDHIRAIIAFFEKHHKNGGVRNINTKYHEYFEKRLKEASSQQTEEILKNILNDNNK